MSSQYGTDLAQYGSSCYELILDPTSWNYAQSLCANGGGKLAAITDSLEQTYLQQFLIRHAAPQVWIGLNDQAREGHMTWSTGRPNNYDFELLIFDRNDCDYVTL